MTMKHIECKNCPLLTERREPKPVEFGAFYNCANGNIDIVVVGHAKNHVKDSVFEGKTGKFVCKELDRYNIAAYGTDMYKCVLSYYPEKPGPDCHPGLRCVELFINELKAYSPRLVVSLGPKPSLTIADKNVMQLPDRPLSVTYYGQEIMLMAVSHPTSIDRCEDSDANWKIWNKRWSVIKEVLNGTKQ